MHLGIVVTRLTQDIHHRTDDVLMLGIRPLDNLYHGLIIRLTTLQLAFRNNNVMHEGAIGWNKESPVFLHTEFTHDLVMGTTHDLDHHRLLDMFVATGHIRHLHTVAIHRRHRVTLCHEHRRTAVIRQERVATVGLATEHTLLHLRLQVQAITIVTDLREEVIPRHLLHRVDGEHLQWMGVELKYLEYLLQRECLVGMMLEEVLQQFADLFLP